MAYDLEQQEQLDAIKAWWAEYGTRLVALLVVVLAAVGGYLGWREWQLHQAEKASAVYGELERAISAHETDKIDSAAARIVNDYPRTVYASMAALRLAQLKLQAGDLAAARAQYDIAIERSTAPEFAALARLRKAAVLLDEKSYDDALKTLGGEAPDGFGALYADRRGDVFRAQDKLDDARREYRAALDQVGDKDPGLRNLIQVKLDALGDG